MRLKRAPVQWDRVPSKKHRQWTAFANVQFADRTIGKEKESRASSYNDTGELTLWDLFQNSRSYRPVLAVILSPTVRQDH